MKRHPLRLPWRRSRAVPPPLAVEHVGPLTEDDIAEVARIVADAARTLAAQPPEQASPRRRLTGPGEHLASSSTAVDTQALTADAVGPARSDSVCAPLASAVSTASSTSTHADCTAAGPCDDAAAAQ